MSKLPLHQDRLTELLEDATGNKQMHEAIALMIEMMDEFEVKLIRSDEQWSAMEKVAKAWKDLALKLKCYVVHDEDCALHDNNEWNKTINECDCGLVTCLE
jgi:hypothetical protein